MKFKPNLQKKSLFMKRIALVEVGAFVALLIKRVRRNAIVTGIIRRRVIERPPIIKAHFLVRELGKKGSREGAKNYFPISLVPSFPLNPL